MSCCALLHNTVMISVVIVGKTLAWIGRYTSVDECVEIWRLFTTLLPLVAMLEGYNC